MKIISRFGIVLALALLAGGCGSTTPTCVTGMVVCANSCVDTTSDARNCGACGTICPANNACVKGVCGLDCITGLSACGAACANLQSDPANCGKCGTACPAGNSCSSGKCVVSCQMGLTVCGDKCADTMADNIHCGDCATACAAGMLCKGGQCVVSCASGLLACGGSCANTQTDAANCGGCGAACMPGFACVAGKCAVSCQAGLMNCNGTCVNLMTDGGHCGGCTTQCPSGNVCMGGSCVPSCATGMDVCGGGCVNLQYDPMNCGKCGTVCGMGQTCTAGACASVCASPLTPCNNGTSCVDPRFDPGNCGGCGKTCPAVANSTPICASSACKNICNTGFLDCNAQPGDGCEINAASDVKNCGKCGNVCTAANATAGCGAGACTVAQCNTGFGDCNKNPADGCEVTTTTDVNNCGACGNACASNQVCNSGVCGTANRVVFGSSIVYTGNLGGLTGADAKCQALAQAVNLPGTFKAWLSDGTQGPAQRLSQSTRDYVLPDGTLVAHGWSGLTSGTLIHAIDQSEKKGVVGKNQPAGFCGEPSNVAMMWTATLPNGNTSGAGSNCTNWTDGASSSAQWGRNDAIDGRWTSWCSGGTCSWSCAIYCIQQ